MPSVTVHHGDSRDVLKTLDANSIDSVATDPPYALVSIVKRFGAEGAAPAQGGVYARASAGFMGQAWDTGETAFDPAFWVEVFRVMKPGAHLAAFGGTRTYHRLVCAIEDAGFEIRDSLAWIFASGFPKSTDFAAVPGSKKTGRVVRPELAGSPFAEGWGSALKPAHEPIVLARKPLEGTLAANVLKWSTGGINIDGCRVDATDKAVFPVGATSADGAIKTGLHSSPRGEDSFPLGRWPANVVHDGSPEVIAAFPSEAGGGFGTRGVGRSILGSNGSLDRDTGQTVGFGDSGSAARFFYSAKADSLARLGGKHPTVKPTDLMRWLITLITPPGGVVLDPFAGSGSTAIGAIAAGFDSVMIEREAEYVEHIRERVAWAQGQGALTSGLATRNKPKAALDGLLGLMGED